MTRPTNFLILATVLIGLWACHSEPAPATGGRGESTPQKETADSGEDGFVRTPARPGTIFNVDYRIIGTPVVGSPVAVDLEIESSAGNEPVEIGYQVPDPSALTMDEAQPRTLTRTPSAGERLIRERITVVPQREGRLYINVRASRSGGDGSNSTMISIPIHVGDVDTSLQEHGQLETDEEGETTRVLDGN